MQYESMSVRARVTEVVSDGFFLAEELNEQLSGADIAFINVLYGDMYLVQLHEEHDAGDWIIRSELEPQGDRFIDETDRLAKEIDDGKKVLDWPGRDERYLVEVSDDD